MFQYDHNKILLPILLLSKILLPILLLSFIAAWWLVPFANDPDRSGDLEDRTQDVLEARCGDRVETLYVPKNSYGVAFTANGERILNMPDCTTVKIGEANSIGGDPK